MLHIWHAPDKQNLWFTRFNAGVVMMVSAHAGLAESNRSAYKCDGDFSWRDVLTEIFPEKTAASVASFTKTSVGAAEHVLRGRNGLSGGALINLLRSPIGNAVLDALVRGVEWRDAERRLLEIQELQNKIELKRRELTRAG